MSHRHTPLSIGRASNAARSSYFARRLQHGWRTVAARISLIVVATYVGAVSLVGFETLALIFVYASAWPIAIPVLVASLAFLFYFREQVLRLLSTRCRHAINTRRATPKFAKANSPDRARSPEGGR